MKPTELPQQTLHTLMTEQCRVITANDGKNSFDKFAFTGSHQNTLDCAKSCFNDDEDQENITPIGCVVGKVDHEDDGKTNLFTQHHQMEW